MYGLLILISKYSNIRSLSNSYLFRFSYDSVDRILLASPHRIGRIDVSVKKGERNMPRRRSPTPGPTPKTQNNNNNNSGLILKKSNLKQVTMSMCIIFVLNSIILSGFYSDEQISRLELPAIKYCIHITNLPVNIDAETLSDEFVWDIYDIVMDPSISDQASPRQCWLKNPNSEGEVDDFVKRWNRKVISGSSIQCEKQEDALELCNQFQLGRCQKTSDVCHWEHVPCTAEGTCSSICPYGHKFGMKAEHDSRNSKSNLKLLKYNYRNLKMRKDGVLCSCCP